MLANHMLYSITICMQLLQLPNDTVIMLKCFNYMHVKLNGRATIDNEWSSDNL